MNAYSKVVGWGGVVAMSFGVVMVFSSNAAAQPAPHTAPAAAPTPAATPAPDAAPHATANEPVPASPAADSESPPPPTTEFAPVEKPAPMVLGEGADSSEQAEPPAPRGPFSARSVRLTLLLGTGSTQKDTYLILGAGVGYFLVDGLEIGADYEAWLFAEPVLQRLSPETRYVFHMVPVIKPYIGAFYRHTFVSDYDDLNSVGGRAGAYIIPRSSRMYFGAGAVYERTLDCSSSAFVDCDSVYPEVTIGVSL